MPGFYFTYFSTRYPRQLLSYGGVGSVGYRVWDRAGLGRGLEVWPSLMMSVDHSLACRLESLIGDGVRGQGRLLGALRPAGRG